MSTSMMALGVTVKLFDQMSGGMGRIAFPSPAGMNRTALAASTTAP